MEFLLNNNLYWTNDDYYRYNGRVYHWSSKDQYIREILDNGFYVHGAHGNVSETIKKYRNVYLNNLNDSSDSSDSSVKSSNSANIAKKLINKEVSPAIEFSGLTVEKITFGTAMELAYISEIKNHLSFFGDNYIDTILQKWDMDFYKIDNKIYGKCYGIHYQFDKKGIASVNKEIIKLIENYK